MGGLLRVAHPRAIGVAAAPTVSTGERLVDAPVNGLARKL